MTTRDINEILSCDSVSKKKGIFTVREGFFYTHGKTEQDLVNFVQLKIPSAKVIDQGTHYANFKGGASVAKSSHWYVKFVV